MSRSVTVGSDLVLGTESPLPTVAAVLLEYPESLAPSGGDATTKEPEEGLRSGFDRFAATLATVRVSGIAMSASSSNSSQKAA